jgi:Xaa-Pro aminopeptidase
MFPPAIYQKRRARLLERMEGGLILFLGNDESPMNYVDNPYPFRQDSTFLYYFGLDEPGLAAALDVDSGEVILFGTDPSLDDVVWMGPRPRLSEHAAATGVNRSRLVPELAAHVAAARRRGRAVHVLPPYRADRTLRLSELLEVPPGAVGGLVSRALVEAVVAQRSVKAPEEVEELEAALVITAAMHTLAMRETRPGRFEREVAGAVEGVALAHGTRVSYPVIFSVRGEVLHNHAHGNRLAAGDLVVNDSGAESPRHYAGDITRTIPVGGRMSSQQREVYALVLAVQEAALAAVRPGVPYRDVHLQAAHSLADGLKALGLMRGDVDEAVAEGAHALFFPHGLGHMLGLDVHDMEDLGETYVGYGEGFERSTQFGLRSLRLAKTLRPGFVLTVEPGLYFIPPLIDRWKAEGRHARFIDYDRLDAYRGFGGIRIEDNVVVEAEGSRVLGPPIPKAIDAVEALAAG